MTIGRFAVRAEARHESMIVIGYKTWIVRHVGIVFCRLTETSSNLVPLTWRNLPKWPSDLVFKTNTLCH